MIVALTGNIGVGKSLASEIFARHGYKIIDADEVGHQLYFDEAIKSRVVGQFGKGILTKGEIDRKKLKKIVFGSAAKLISLNKIVHPALVKQIAIEIKNSRSKRILVEAALILEFKFRHYDLLVLVTADRSTQVKRLLKKGKYTLSEINNIIDSQMPQEKKMVKADYIINNSGSKTEFSRNVEKIIKALG